MKRDMELVRKILLLVENGNPDEKIDNYSDDEIKYHRALVEKAGLAEGKILEGPTEIPRDARLKNLTWVGHDFIDAIKSESDWEKVKAFLQKTGKQINIETIKIAVIQLFGFPSS